MIICCKIVNSILANIKWSIILPIRISGYPKNQATFAGVSGYCEQNDIHLPESMDIVRTVVCTIHQPSIDIFEAFDELLLMKRGGQVIYAGPLSPRSHKLVEYFEVFVNALELLNPIKDK